LRADFWGFGMLAVGMGALQIMLDKGQEDDWFNSNFIVILAITAVVMLVGFVIRELLHRPAHGEALELFRNTGPSPPASSS
jgi:DHA2 family multidrug resistance protein